MENEQTYNGSCHCGAVTYTVTMPTLTSAVSCNCSHCFRKGFLLTFVPKAQVAIQTGEDNLTEYRFNKKHIAHLFCRTCGVACFGFGTDPEGNETAAVNLRTIENLDTSALQIHAFNGKDL